MQSLPPRAHVDLPFAKYDAYKKRDGRPPRLAFDLAPHYRDSYGRPRRPSPRIHAASNKSALTGIFARPRAKRGRAVIGSRGLIRRVPFPRSGTPAGLLVASFAIIPAARAYRKLSASLPYPSTYHAEIVSSRLTRSARRPRRASRLTRLEIIVRADVIKRIAPRDYCEGTAAPRVV